jgi:hypothetical protein
LASQLSVYPLKATKVKSVYCAMAGKVAIDEVVELGNLANEQLTLLSNWGKSNCNAFGLKFNATVSLN